MALLFMDSWDHYTTLSQKWQAQSGGNTSVQGAAARHGIAGLRCGVQNGSMYARRTSLTPSGNFVIGFGFQRQAEAGTATKQIVAVYESGGTTLHLDVRLVVATSLLIVTRNGTQLGSTGATPLNVGTWYFVEFKGSIHDSTGSFEVRINGVSEISASSQDTRNGGSGTWDTVQLGSNVGTGTNTTVTYYYDDCYVCDSSGSVNNDFLGDVRVAALLPTGAGNTTQWTPSAGSNYQNVDEAAPDGDTTYNSETTASDKDTFAMADMPTSPSTVHGTQELTWHRKDDAGARTLRQVVRSNATDYESANISVADTYQYARSVRETDPNTSAAWSESAVNAMEAGYKLQA